MELRNGEGIGAPSFNTTILALEGLLEYEASGRFGSTR